MNIESRDLVEFIKNTDPDDWAHGTSPDTFTHTPSQISFHRGGIYSGPQMYADLFDEDGLEAIGDAVHEILDKTETLATKRLRSSLYEKMGRTLD